MSSETDRTHNSTIEEELNRKGNILSRNVGDSMLPLLRQDRDIAFIVSYTGNLKKYDVPLYRRDSGQYVLHRCLRARGGNYVLCGDNRYQREYGVEDRHIIGVLAGVYRDGRFISVKDTKYRWYVHLWCDFFYVRAAVLFLRDIPRRLRKRVKKQ